MIRLLKKLSVHALLVGILLGMTATIAFSMTLYSPRMSMGCYLGYCYENQSDISGEPEYTVFSAGTMVFADQQVPAGHVGAQAKLLRNGLLCSNSATVYSPNPSYGYGININSSCGSGDYQSAGTGLAYNGQLPGGYAVKGTYITPVIQKN